jgi:hypothetical protein
VNRTQRWTGVASSLLVGALITVSGCSLPATPKIAIAKVPHPIASKNPVKVAAKVPVTPVAMTPADTTALTRQQDATKLAASLRVMNYYPSDHSWQQMWTSWSAAGFDRDMAKISGTGANAVRLIVFPSVFSFPTPDATMAGRLREAITIAAAHGLQVQLTLFDYWGDYQDLAGARTWSTALLTPYRDDPRVALVEIRNEIHAGDARAMTWARDQITLLHTVLPTTPVTISTAGAQGVSGLRALKAALTPAEPDIFDFHYYGLSQLAFSAFQQSKAAVAGAPLFVGEAGMSTYTPGTNPIASDAAEAAQADWYRVVDGAANAAGLSPVAPWTLYDFVPAGAPAGFSPEQFSYGLFHVDGTPKRAAAVVSAAFHGTLSSAAPNGTFADLLSSALPVSWIAWLPTGALSVSIGGGVSGENALALRRTTQQAAGVSSWYTIPTQAVVPSQTWHASVQASGVDATGLNDLTLGWFDASGAWLGNSSSSALASGTTSWHTLTVSAHPPAGAAAVRIYLRSRGNSGSVLYSRAAWTVSS